MASLGFGSRGECPQCDAARKARSLWKCRSQHAAYRNGRTRCRCACGSAGDCHVAARDYSCNLIQEDIFSPERYLAGNETGHSREGTNGQEAIVYFRCINVARERL